MVRAEAGAGVPVEVLVEQQVVAPVGVVLKLADTVIEPPTSTFAAGEETDHPIGEIARHIARRESRTGRGRCLNLQRRSERLVELDERLDEQERRREPDRSPPVRVAAL